MTIIIKRMMEMKMNIKDEEEEFGYHGEAHFDISAKKIAYS
jgi:hypothetical protein